MTVNSADVQDTAVLDLTVSPGRPLPLGCSIAGDRINFAVFSRHAERVELLLFDEVGDARSAASTVTLSEACHRTGDIWHVSLEGLRAGLRYAWRADGPYAPAQGHRFNPHKVLLDPYAIALVGTDCWDFACACGDEAISGDPPECTLSTLDNASTTPQCLIVEPETFDWQDDCPLRHPWSETIIYETHVRGFTVHPSAEVRHPGSYLGLIEKIPHLQKLGITAVELMPVQEFFENELTRTDPRTGERLRNYWGYSTVAFFAPKESYSSRAFPGCQITEFKTMVRALHQAGIEVILDVVFNHTAEGDHTGPTLNYRGLDNPIYYLLERDARFYRNYSGCGNTFNCGHPVVRDHVLDCLRYWVIEMHVDGFRFDLASILGRDEDGRLVADPPLLERIAEDPVLRDVKLIAEAWDASGAYQVGSFPGKRWSEWNGRYRDDVRRFWRSDTGMYGAFASRLCGSADVYEHGGKQPLHSINYVTCHDGFTLNDLVSYERKHNEANGEAGRDGSDENFSANYGVEGESPDAAIEEIRIRQIKNMLATLFLSRGVPMLLGGDEFRRTQRGNNNAYCQDNDLSWHDWSRLETNAEIVDFVASLISFRKQHEVLRSLRFYEPSELTWFDASGRVPRWDAAMRGLGCGISVAGNGAALCLLFNPEEASLVFRLPEPLRALAWRPTIDTARRTERSRPATFAGACDRRLAARSLQVLVSSAPEAVR